MIRLENLNTGVSITVAHLPDRKKPILIVGDKCVAKPYATFRNDTDAEEFMNVLADFVGATKNEVIE